MASLKEEQEHAGCSWGLCLSYGSLSKGEFPFGAPRNSWCWGWSGGIGTPSYWFFCDFISICNLVRTWSHFTNDTFINTITRNSQVVTWFGRLLTKEEFTPLLWALSHWMLLVSLIGLKASTTFTTPQQADLTDIFMLWHLSPRPMILINN